jgi:hypothetical protein
VKLADEDLCVCDEERGVEGSFTTVFATLDAWVRRTMNRCIWIKIENGLNITTVQTMDCEWYNAVAFIR